MSQDILKNAPEIVIDPAGNASWRPVINDYNPNLFYRGKTVTNTEFNDLFIKQAAQSNYTARTLSDILSKYLNTIIGRKFESDYNLVKSYVLEIASETDWGEQQPDGYYYITIPASAHGFAPAADAAEKGINIDTELYLRDPDTAEYYEVLQIYTDLDNTVTLYTDDPRTVGVAVIRTNERAYALSGSTLTTSQISDIAAVAKTNDYNSLYNLPDLSGITDNTERLDKLYNGTVAIKNAESATYVTGFIKGISIDNILYNNTYVVQEAALAHLATKATYAESAGLADRAVYTDRADLADSAAFADRANYTANNTEYTIEERLRTLEQAVLNR